MADDPAPPEGGRRSTTNSRIRSGWTSSAWNWLLVIPLIGTLVPAFYDQADPRLAGIPFFYWYQMLWIPIAVAVTLLVYRATTRVTAPGTPPSTPEDAPAGEL